LDILLPNGGRATYAFEIGALSDGRYRVQREVCRVDAQGDAGDEPAVYDARDGHWETAYLDLRPALAPDRLALPLMSAHPVFRPVYDFVTHMGFYNLSPDTIRNLQDPDPAQVLKRRGENLTSLLDTLEQAVRDRIAETLAVIAPGLKGVKVKQLANKQTLEFRMEVAEGKEPWRFPAGGMSDGTLRALGVLVALYQGAGATRDVPVVAIEEPEATIHPAALAALAGAALEAANHSQVVLLPGARFIEHQPAA
jgi:hypothetical protein